MRKVVKKLWGIEKWLHNDDKYCMKQLNLNLGYTSSQHMHKIKEETFLVTSGRVCMMVNDVIHILDAGDSLTIMPGIYHSFASLTPVAIVVEASTKHLDSDVFRRTASCKNGGSLESFLKDCEEKSRGRAEQGN